MEIDNSGSPRSHGDGHFDNGDFKLLGKNVVIEKGVFVFHPEKHNDRRQM